jgi:DNA-binding GntR family transcriptional regulator
MTLPAPVPTSGLNSLPVTPDLVERVRNVMMDAICSGELAEGERFTQEQLAQQLGVSRQPVLQALLLLREQGIVKDTPNRRGVFVAPLDEAFVRELYTVRAQLEALAAELAAAQVTPALRQSGLDLIRQGRNAAQQHNMPLLVQLDLQFHQWMHQGANNRVLLETSRQHALQVRRVMARFLRPAAAGRQSWAEHHAMAEAILDGDQHHASTLARHHVEHAASFVIQQLTQGTSRSITPTQPQPTTRRQSS